MKRRASAFLYILAAILFVLHQDFWLFGNATLVLGFFPIGLLYHLIFCAAASVLMLALTRFAWPHHLDREPGQPDREGGGPWH